MHELLHHPARRYEPQSNFTSTTTQSHTCLVERVIKSFRRDCDRSVKYGNSIWKGIDDVRDRARNIILNGSVQDVETMLRAPAHSNILFGFENTFAEYVAVLREDPGRQAFEARWTHDALARLTEALGAVNCAGPEAPHLDQTLDVNTLIALIEQRYDVSLEFPNPFENEFGVHTGRGIASLRAIHAIYQAFRVYDVLRLSGGNSVLEIGAGLGRTAYYCIKLFGIRYAIYDLPLTNAVQAYFLGVTLGEDRVALSGEPYDPGRHEVRLMSVGEDLSLQMKCDVLLNVDSMTEIDIDAAKAYIDFAYNIGACFLSINHEGQSFRVSDLLQDRGLRALRFPYWMRKGYVEEIVFGFDLARRHWNDA